MTLLLLIHFPENNNRPALPAPIFVKNLRYSDKESVIRVHRELKHLGISIVEDLTRNNQLLLNRLNNDERFLNAWFFKGSVLCTLKNSSGKICVGLYQSIDKAIEESRVFNSRQRTNKRPDGGRDRADQHPQQQPQEQQQQQQQRLQQQQQQHQQQQQLLQQQYQQQQQHQQHYQQQRDFSRTDQDSRTVAPSVIVCYNWLVQLPLQLPIYLSLYQCMSLRRTIMFYLTLMKHTFYQWRLVVKLQLHFPMYRWCNIYFFL